MATIIAENSYGDTTRYTLEAGDTISVPSTVDVSSFQRTAIVGKHSDITVNVAGQIYGHVIGISLGDNAAQDSGATVRIAAGASISSAGSGIEIEVSDSAFSNYGSIIAIRGVYMQGAVGSVSSLANGGVISASFSGLSFGGAGRNTITNTGTIEGSSYSIFSRGSSADAVANRGTLMGDVWLGAGADVFDGRNGTVDGVIFGGRDADRFIPGEAIEQIDGGTQFDVLDFRTSSRIFVALDGSFEGIGAASGDSYISIEGVMGSLTGADTLTGNSAANSLSGFGGADELSGGQGKDTLVGGAGGDRLTGNEGNDTFVFQNLNDCGDVITDFSNAGGNNDLLRITAAGFGGGLEAGALAAGQFVTAANNMAQDANDRFIFRTTDRTLWFDANGSATGELTLVADLQAGASFAAADILLV